MYGLLEADEEVDSAVYAAYLRAQSDADLLDILQHLDDERYPARVDAVRRETMRRSVLPVTVHSPEERFIRGLCVVAFALAATVALLTLLLTAEDAAGPRWPDFDDIPAGTPASEILRQVMVGMLRATVVAGTQMELAPLLLLILAGWLIYRIGSRAIRGDVKWLTVVATGVLCLAFFVAAAPFSSVPNLSGFGTGQSGYWDRLHSLLLPW